MQRKYSKSFGTQKFNKKVKLRSLKIFSMLVISSHRSNIYFVLCRYMIVVLTNLTPN